MKDDPHERFTASEVINHPWITRRFDKDIPMSRSERLKAFSQSLSFFRVL